MLGTILIVVLILMLLAHSPHGRTAEAGDTTPPADWD